MVWTTAPALRYPFKEVEDLLTVDSQVFDSSVEAYIYCNEHHQHANDYYDPGMMMLTQTAAMTPKPITMEPPLNFLRTKQDLRQICYMVALPGGDDLTRLSTTLSDNSFKAQPIKSIQYASNHSHEGAPFSSIHSPNSRHLVT
ncbi:hypothetical protein V8E54_008345 [Elaphomyces granulatus]|jgi:hypothetical protein